MSFSRILKEAVERVDGAISAMIIGSDGMPVESHTIEKVLNLDTMSAESSQMMRGIDMAAESLGLGNASELTLVSDLCSIIIRKINQEYYIALIIKPGGSLGKGRFVLRSTIPKIAADFS